LRRTKTGIEKGVKRPKNLNKVLFLEEIRRLRYKKEDSEEGITGQRQTIAEILQFHRRVFDPDQYPTSRENRLQKRSLRSIFRILRRQGAIPPMTYCNFLKIIKTHGPHLLKG
jgi:ribosomal protein L19E